MKINSLTRQQLLSLTPYLYMPKKIKKSKVVKYSMTEKEYQKAIKSIHE